jgi:hypothetical protein
VVKRNSLAVFPDNILQSKAFIFIIRIQIQISWFFFIMVGRRGTTGVSFLKQKGVPFLTHPLFHATLRWNPYENVCAPATPESTPAMAMTVNVPNPSNRTVWLKPQMNRLHGYEYETRIYADSRRLIFNSQFPIFNLVSAAILLWRRCPKGGGGQRVDS